MVFRPIMPKQEAQGRDRTEGGGERMDGNGGPGCAGAAAGVQRKRFSLATLNSPARAMPSPRGDSGGEARKSDDETRNGAAVAEGGAGVRGFKRKPPPPAEQRGPGECKARKTAAGGKIVWSEEVGEREDMEAEAPPPAPAPTREAKSSAPPPPAATREREAGQGAGSERGGGFRLVAQPQEKERSIGKIKIEVVGCRFYTAAVAKPRSAGQAAMLVREPTNTHDPMAIKVEVPGAGQVGHVPKETSKWLALLLDEGCARAKPSLEADAQPDAGAKKIAIIVEFVHLKQPADGSSDAVKAAWKTLHDRVRKYKKIVGEWVGGGVGAERLQVPEEAVAKHATKRSARPSLPALDAPEGGGGLKLRALQPPVDYRVLLRRATMRRGKMAVRQGEAPVPLDDMTKRGILSAIRLTEAEKAAHDPSKLGALVAMAFDRDLEEEDEEQAMVAEVEKVEWDMQRVQDLKHSIRELVRPFPPRTEGSGKAPSAPTPQGSPPQPQAMAPPPPQQRGDGSRSIEAQARPQEEPAPPREQQTETSGKSSQQQQADRHMMMMGQASERSRSLVGGMQILQLLGESGLKFWQPHQMQCWEPLQERTEAIDHGFLLPEVDVV